MTERRLGEALRAMVSAEAGGERASGAGESVLMNPNRQRIFEFLCFYPCSTPSQISQALRMSGPTVQWHLVKLARAEYVRDSPSGRSHLYFPAGLGLDDLELATLTAVNGLGGSRLLSVVVAQPGLTLRQLGEATGLGAGAVRLQASRLANAGLLVVVTDGRYRRFYPSEAILRLEKAARRKLRAFRARLLKRMERERLSPTTQLSLSREQEVQIRVGDRAYVMRLPSGSLLNAVTALGGSDG